MVASPLGECPLTWSPQQYQRFSSERRQPFDDLLSLLDPASSPRVVDLGCGTGELTAELHRHTGARETLGVDASPEMLREAARQDVHGLRFEQGDIGRFTPPEPFDIVFSNAALQWVPDPVRTMARVLASVAPGGQVAIQVPSNQDSVSHRVAREVSTGFAPQPALVPDVLPPELYAELLARAGFQGVHVQQQVYIHWLDGPEAVVEWVKGTLLTAWQRALSPVDFEVFLRVYRTRLLQTLPNERPFFVPFKRTLMWARKPA